MDIFVYFEVVTIYDIFNFVVDINECNTGTPCSNGGICSNTIGSFTCNCTGTGFGGATCTDSKSIFTKYLFVAKLR